MDQFDVAHYAQLISMAAKGNEKAALAFDFLMPEQQLAVLKYKIQSLKEKYLNKIEQGDTQVTSASEFYSMANVIPFNIGKTSKLEISRLIEAYHQAHNCFPTRRQLVSYFLDELESTVDLIKVNT
ncbi:hypothetical protein [Spartinivicinus poritis]|uniref:Uncharacterized protein n=1 Tax=Spartinivicinus poritis TaxID=2994640 RepID=A0ABT5UBV1_9GAMM|nr:hypothetical protein [Spartinivicinus sp. A2-2]MDE1462913.1 hypothetical protein [Spartinivicinus sp. A2-2]